MNTQELAGLSPKQLQVKLTEQEEKLLDLRFQIASGSLKQVSIVGDVRKTIARIKTKLRQIHN